jgi:hypothetical protein
MQMRTAADVAADKKAQEAESNRRHADQTDNVIIADETLPEAVDDNPNPAPPPAPEPAPQVETPPAETPPAPEPDKPEDARAAAARRIKERRARERAEFDTAPAANSSHEPPFVKPLAPAEEPIEPVAEETPPPPAAPEKLTIKVNGAESQHSREDLVKLAGLDPEDAEGVPDKALIKAAQINEAARIKLEKSRTVPGAPPAPAAPAAIPAATNEPPAEPAPQKPARAIPAKVKEALEKFTYGDPEEATNAFIDAIDAVHEERNTSARINELKGDNQRAIVQFSESNPDIAQDPRASRFLLTQITAEIINDLRDLGAPEANLQGLHLQPNIAIEAHTQARLAGRNVRAPADIMNAAGSEVRSAFQMKKPGEDPPPPPPPPPTPTNNRLEAKRQLTQQPQRSGNPPPPAPPAPPLTRSSTVMKMRQARGLPVD